MKRAAVGAAGQTTVLDLGGLSLSSTSLVPSTRRPGPASAVSVAAAAPVAACPGGALAVIRAARAEAAAARVGVAVGEAVAVARVGAAELPEQPLPAAPQSDFVLDPVPSSAESSTAGVAFSPQPARKPKTMTRAKQWNIEVENLFRFQSAGFRDLHEYLETNAPPDFWPDSNCVKCLKTRQNTFYYFRPTRECDDKYLSKIKIYGY